tara:strand:+ start:91 stop:918 length:828 start_codon:yes stop_codon:yes gene_type:complete
MDKFLNKNSVSKLSKYEYRYAITFGEVAILHVGGKEIGNGIRDEGFTTKELKVIKENLGEQAEYISLSDNLPEELRNDNEAGVLVIRCVKNTDIEIPVSVDFADRLYKEQLNVKYDDKYFDKRRQKTLNKRARKNIVFGKNKIVHSEDYKQPSVESFSNLDNLSLVKDGFSKILGDKALELNGEGNWYDHDKSGIGFHGDAERKIVICLSLGKSSVLRYQWRMPGSSEHILKPIDININHGDIYVMSEKATGFDWKSRSKVRVVHAAGHKSYISK